MFAKRLMCMICFLLGATCETRNVLYDVRVSRRLIRPNLETGNGSNIGREPFYYMELLSRYMVTRSNI